MFGEEVLVVADAADRSGPSAVDPLTGDRLARAIDLMSRAAVRGVVSEADLLRSLGVAAATAVAVDGVAVDGVAVMAADGGGTLRLVHAEPEWVIEVERLQERHRRGPGWDCARTGRVVKVPDVRAAQRWPELAAYAARTDVGGGPFAAVASLPVQAPAGPRAVLDLYRRPGRPWTAADLGAVRLCTQVAASYLLLAAGRDAWKTAWTDLQYRSTHDDLTGLPGRGLLFDRLDHAIATATRRGDAVAVLFIDVDGFKAVNDAHGHAVGDVTLAEVARRLGLALRSSDTLARLSGDEFVIICEDLTGPMPLIHALLRRLGERILLELRSPAGPGRAGIDVTVSIGAAVTTRYCSAQTLTTHADHAMYAAKRGGGARLVISRTNPPFPATA